jgi:hypothetical protein
MGAKYVRDADWSRKGRAGDIDDRDHGVCGCTRAATQLVLYETSTNNLGRDVIDGERTCSDVSTLPTGSPGVPRSYRRLSHTTESYKGK